MDATPQPQASTSTFQQPHFHFFAHRFRVFHLPPTYSRKINTLVQTVVPTADPKHDLDRLTDQYIILPNLKKSHPDVPCTQSLLLARIRSCKSKMVSILFVLSLCLAFSPFVSAQCYEYYDENSCFNEYSNKGCWWLTQSGAETCTEASMACYSYYDESSCNDNSNNACEYDTGNMNCQQSSCMTNYNDEGSCTGQSDYVGSCSWDSNKNVCVRGATSSGSPSEPTCASYNSDCTPDKLQGTCILSDWDNNQGSHNTPTCQKLVDLCNGMGGDEANCGGSYNAISEYDFMPWCYYDKTAGSCVASNCHQKKDETSCNSACK